MEENKSQPTTTKWQQLMDSTKGSIEFNPSQAFALHVFWVVRSLKAATEMIEKGFIPCAKATQRDTPTTLAYFFRLARDQSLATKLKEEVKTIGQHPHYQPAFKSLQMGIAKPSVELKLKMGGIDVAPLNWKIDEPISDHAAELDFDPVVIECTEIYLDNQSFYLHAASRDWMKAYPEIMKAVRSLKPTTYCVGNPESDVWSKTLEPSLKAILVNPENNAQAKALHPALALHNGNVESDFVFFLELDFTIGNDKLETYRNMFAKIQSDLNASWIIVLPTNIHESPKDVVSLRIMMSFACQSSSSSSTLQSFATECPNLEGQLLVFESPQTQDSKGRLEKDRIEARKIFATKFLSTLKTEKILYVDGHVAENEKKLAGYALHPLYSQLKPNNNLIYHP